jgi:hypothetical protein
MHTSMPAPQPAPTERLIDLRRERHDEPLPTSREEVERAIDGLADDETQVLVSALRRGQTWTGAQEQVQRVRAATIALDEDAHRCAVGLYCDSVLLTWDECADVSPAMTYRPA